MSLIRPTDDQFAEVPFAQRYACDHLEVPLDGLDQRGRVAVVDQPAASETRGTFLLLHGEPSWSALYEHWIPELTAPRLPLRRARPDRLRPQRQGHRRRLVHLRTPRRRHRTRHPRARPARRAPGGAGLGRPDRSAPAGRHARPLRPHVRVQHVAAPRRLRVRRRRARVAVDGRRPRSPRWRHADRPDRVGHHAPPRPRPRSR
jgi:hypothetical protein